jgi:acetate kinase
MGFSPTEGLVMATRCGDIDPGAIVHLMRNKKMAPEMVEQLINAQSGLLGLSGKSADMRDLINETDTQAELAVEMYCYRLRKYVGAYQTVLGRADGIMFGGGVGEHSPQVRDRVLSEMQWCGIELDADANRQAISGEARISTNDSRVDIRVLPVDEAALLAEEAYLVLKGEKKESHHD